MKRVLALLASMSLIGAAVSNPAFAAVKSGVKCPKAGATATNENKKFTCIKSGKVFVWDSGLTITKSTKKNVQSSPTENISQNANCGFEGQFLTKDMGTYNASFLCVKSGGKNIWGETCFNMDRQKDFNGSRLTCLPVTGTQYFVWAPGPVTTPVESIGSIPSALRGTLTPQYPQIATPVISQSSEFESTQTCALNATIPNSDPQILQNLNFAHGDWMRTKGTVKIAVIFASYTNAKLNPRAITKWEQSQEPYAQKFYEQSSYGQLSLDFVSSHKVYEIPKSSDVYKMTMPMAPNSSLFIDAMEAAKTDYDFSQVDEVLVVVPDEAIFDGGVSFTLGATVGGSHIRFGIVAQFANADPNGNPYEPGWLTHEFGETIGLTEPEILPWTGTPSAWDMMSWNSNYEQDLYAWEKLILGWISPNQMACLDVASMNSVNVFLTPDESPSNDTKLVVVKLSQYQAIVIESRRNSGLDPLSPAQEGVLVYKLDLNKGWRQGTITDLYSNPTTICGSSGCQLLGTLHQGETITSDGAVINVIKFTDVGDYVSISKSA